MANYFSYNPDLNLDHQFVTKFVYLLAALDDIEFVEWVDIYDSDDSVIWHYIRKAEILIQKLGISEQSNVEQAQLPSQLSPQSEDIGTNIDNSTAVSSIDVSSVPITDDIHVFDEEVTTAVSKLIDDDGLHWRLSVIFADYFYKEQMVIRMMENGVESVATAKTLVNSYFNPNTKPEMRATIAQMAGINQ